MERGPGGEVRSDLRKGAPLSEVEGPAEGPAKRQAAPPDSRTPPLHRSPMERGPGGEVPTELVELAPSGEVLSAATPLQRLLDLDAGRLPPLVVRVDGRDVPLRLPESLSLADTLRLGDLLRALADPAATPQRFDAAAAEVVALVAPPLGPDGPTPLPPGQARRLVAFYAAHLARAAEALSGADGVLPFAMAQPLAASAPGSP